MQHSSHLKPAPHDVLHLQENLAWIFPAQLLTCRMSLIFCQQATSMSTYHISVVGIGKQVSDQLEQGQIMLLEESQAQMVDFVIQISVASRQRNCGNPTKYIYWLQEWKTSVPIHLQKMRIAHIFQQLMQSLSFFFFFFFVAGIICVTFDDWSAAHSSTNHRN